MLKIIICILAGLGAGLGTGFAGMSAAAVIAPMLITFLDIPAYEAVGIAEESRTHTPCGEQFLRLSPNLVLQDRHLASTRFD